MLTTCQIFGLENRLTTQTPGWYPDPNNSNSEVYWDGERWHGRRQKLQKSSGLPSGDGQVADTLTFPSNVIPQAWMLAWRRLSSGAQALLIIAVIAVFATLLLAFLHAKPWESQREKDCSAAMEAQGYRGSQLDAAVKFCVDAGK